MEGHQIGRLEFIQVGWDHEGGRLIAGKIPPGVNPVRLFLSLSSETVFCRKPPPIAISAVALRRDCETVQMVRADHRAAFSV